MSARKRTLSKSDFKLGTDCLTKLYYKKMGYASANDDDEYLGFLAEGGYLIGAVAKLVIPGGIDIQHSVRDPKASYHETTLHALKLTRSHLQQERVVLYEPAFQVGQLLVRVDILVKDGSKIELMEVKSKAQDSSNPKWEKDWEPYIQDVAFQWLVVQAAMPQCRVSPWLMTPDKSHVATIDQLTSYFRLHELGNSGRFRDTEVEFTGDDVIAKQIRECGLLRRWDMQDLVADCQAEVEQSASAMEAWLAEEPLKHPKTSISKDCFRCEYDADSVDGRNGFRECWGKLASPDRHIRHLHRVGTLGGWRNPKANLWIREGRVAHDDLDVADLLNNSGQLTSTAERVWLQINHSRAGTEWFDTRGLATELASWEYPLHFIDFEASASPIPYHRGMRPYQTVVFQWSCHTISSPGAEPVHSEYLNTRSHYPAVDFLESLRRTIGNRGTALMWSPYERTQLKNLRDWLRSGVDGDQEDLVGWIGDLVGDQRDEQASTAPRLVDQHALVVKHWFHPRMKGRTSIKVALPAALAAVPKGRIDRWLSEVNLLDPDTGDRPENPYLLLPTLDVPGLTADDFEYESAASVIDGVEAMRAYQDMVYGRHMNNPSRHEQIADALRRYCRLDTLAQVIIWEHWQQRLQMATVLA